MTRNTEQTGITHWLDNAGRYETLAADRVILISREIQALPEDNPRRRKLINKLVKHNLKLVIRYVHSFMNGSSHNKWGGPETLDYLQTGALGLVRAAEMYDPTRGYAFSTYANFWIRSMISRYNMKTITPVYVSESASREIIFYKRNGYLRLRNGDRDTSNKKIQDVARLVGAAYQCVSLNTTNDYDHELIDTVRSHDSGVQLDAAYEEIDRTLASVGISSVGREILLSCVVEGQTVTEVSKRLSLSVQQVKTIKRRAILLAQRCPEAFGLTSACSVYCPSKTAPIGETQWLQSLSSAK